MGGSACARSEAAGLNSCMYMGSWGCCWMLRCWRIGWLTHRSEVLLLLGAGEWVCVFSWEGKKPLRAFAWRFLIARVCVCERSASGSSSAPKLHRLETRMIYSVVIDDSS